MPSATIFAVSFALLINEIMLSAIFQVLLGAANTSAAIAVALIGLAASGVIAYSIPALHTPERAPALYPKLLFAFSTSLMVGSLLIMRVPINHIDLTDSRGGTVIQLWHLSVLHIAVLPFFLGGLIIAVLLRAYPDRSSRLYAFDLAGSALGCACSPLLLSTFGAPAAIVYGAVPSVALAAWLGARARVLPRILFSLPLAVLLLQGLRPDLWGFTTLNTMGDVRAPAYRSFRIRPDDLEFEKWALDAWTIIRSDRIPQEWENFKGWGLSERYEGPVPQIRLINYNARFSTYVTKYDGDTHSIGRWLDADLISLHYRLGRSFETVLNIGAGGGREVLNALHHRAKRVVAVDVSDVVVNDIMKNYLLEFSGSLYLDPRVTAIADEGRTFTERAHEQFDLIDFSIVGGANLEKMDLVRVDDLFTLEALRTYLDRLSPDGIFSYVMYTTRSDLISSPSLLDAPAPQPYIPALRTLTGVRIALEGEAHGSRFADHVLIAALSGVIDPRYDLVHIIASKSPFTSDERRAFQKLCRELGFKVLFPPDGADGDAQNLYAQVIGARDLAHIADSLSFSIWPTTDDRPFQYPLDWNHIQRALQRGALLELLAGNPLIPLSVSTGLVAVLVTFVPLVVLRSRGGIGTVSLHRSGYLLLYFACIGFAYMAVEIPALLRLQLYLGNPIYGLSVGLFAFLLASGVGSSVTGFFDASRLTRNAGAAVVLVLVGGFGFLWLSRSLFGSTISYTLPWRILIAVGVVFPLALPMGMLFPIGIKLMARESGDLIPWAWAANGCMSVLGILGTRVSAVFLGFSHTLCIGLLVYSLVPLVILLHARVASDARDHAG
jgi:SAM-dependent methyltransferase